MSRVVHFEIHAKDRMTIAKFYSDVFDWKMNHLGPEMGNYTLVETGGVSQPDQPATWGINGGITERMGDLPKEGQAVNAFVNIIGVEDVDETIAKVKAAGGTIALDKMEMPTVGTIAYFKDPEGNLFGIIKPVPM